MGDQAEHAYFSPSASHQWIPCPGSLALITRTETPTGGSSYPADEGTAMHIVGAECLQKKRAAEEWLGEIITVGSNHIPMTMDLLEAVQFYVDEVRGKAHEIKAKGGFIEVKVKITDKCWGTSDAIMYNDTTVVVDDLKGGKGVVVQAENNTQLMLYGVGVLRKLQQDLGLKPEKVILRIIQPRTPNPVRVFETTRTYLLDWMKNTVVRAMSLALNATADNPCCHAGESQCRWCPVDLCPFEANAVINDAEAAFAPATEDAPRKPTVVATEGELLTVADLIKLKETSFSWLTSWMSKVNTYLHDAALRGVGIPGWKLVHGKGSRAWLDEVKARAILVQNSIKPDAEPKMKTLPAVEKEIGKKRFKALDLYSLQLKKKGNPMLAPESDTRAEYMIEAIAEKDFADAAQSSTGANLAGELDDDMVDKIMTAQEVMNRKELPPEVIAEGDFAEFATEITEVVVDQSIIPEGYDDDDDEEDDPLASIGSLGMGTQRKMDPLSGVGTHDSDAVSDEIKEAHAAGKMLLMEQRPPTANPKAPGKRTKRHIVLEMGDGNTTVEDLAKLLSTSNNTVLMHIRYLHERDGYGYAIFSNGTYRIYDADDAEKPAKR